MIDDVIQYSFALIDESEDYVNISDIDRAFAAEHKFRCPCCNKEMYATFGPIKVPHFRHNGEKCDYDNYLHAIAEDYFLKEFSACIDQKQSFLLDYTLPVKCDQKCIVDRNICGVLKQERSIDLAQKYTRISREKRVSVDGSFRRPDILLESEYGEQLWVEIWVKHKTVEDKRKQGNILEIKISYEGDLEQFKEHHLKESERVHYYPQDSVIKECDDPVIPEDKSISEPKLTQNEETLQSSAWREERPNKDDKYDFRARVKPEPQDDVVFSGWIDLGLPSGTLWANGTSGKMDFGVAIEKYGDNVPTSAQFDELRSNCKADWEDMYFARFTGPNGNSIRLKHGWYWLNSYNMSHKPTNRADCIHLFFGGHGLINDKEVFKELSVRLVNHK